MDGEGEHHGWTHLDTDRRWCRSFPAAFITFALNSIAVAEEKMVKVFILAGQVENGGLTLAPAAGD